MRASRGMGDINPAKMHKAKKFAEGGKVKNWIAGAIKHPGALRKKLGAKEGEPIPEKKLAAAAGKSGKIGKQARLAQTLKGFK